MMLFQVLPLAAGSDPLSHVKDAALFGEHFTIHMLFAAFAGILCVMVMPWVARRVADPAGAGRLASVFEVICLFLRDEVARPFLGKDGDRFLPVLWSFFFFILFCNLLGMIPVIGYTATSNLNVTIALAVISFVFYNMMGIRENGLLPYLKATFLVGPWFLWPLMIVIEAVGFILKPAALALRLFANMVAGHTILAVLIGFTLALTSGINLFLGGTVTLASLGGAVAIFVLEIFIAFLQAFIFTFLTTVFLSMALHPDH